MVDVFLANRIIQDKLTSDDGHFLAKSLAKILSSLFYIANYFSNSDMDRKRIKHTSEDPCLTSDIKLSSIKKICFRNNVCYWCIFVLFIILV